MFGEIAIKHYKNPSIRGIKNVLIEPLFPLWLQASLSWNSDSIGYHMAVKLLYNWFGKMLFLEWVQSDSLQGVLWNEQSWHHTLCESQPTPNSQTRFSRHSHLYSQPQKKYKLSAVPVIFDQPLYIKAADIVASSPELLNVFLRLGGFYLVMSYLCWIYHELEWFEIHVGNCILCK